jgi:hypothetical protein
MAQEQKLFRCEDDDPGRCQGVGAGGQCPFLSIDAAVARGLMPGDPVITKGVDKCPRHGANKKVQSNDVHRSNAYRLQVWQERVDEFAESDNVGSLRGEIGILRMILEQVVCQAGDVQELLLYSPKIQSLAAQIGQLATRCFSLERSLGLVLSKASAMQFASEVVDVIREHIDDDVKIESISSGIITALSNLRGVEDD